MLEYKITELQRQIAPRKDAIKSLTQQLEQMTFEVDRYESHSKQLQLQVSEQSNKVRGIESDITEQKSRQSDHRQQLHELLVDLDDLTAVLDQPKVLKERFKAVYHKSVVVFFF